MEGYDGVTCKVCPSLATDGETTLISYAHLLLSGCDVVKGSFLVRSTDGGKTFSAPIAQPALADTREEGLRRTYCGAVCYSRFHRKWFFLGTSEIYANDVESVSHGGISVAEPFQGTVDPETGLVTDRKPLEFPLEAVCAMCVGQNVELENGDLLIPFYFMTVSHPRAMVVTVRYAFTPDGLRPVRVGTPLAADAYGRGLCEPSLTRFGGKYYLTLRTDEVGLFAVSEDGCVFSEPKPYRWEDGSVLENYNTQQHWMRGPDSLCLAYTRKGAHNDHVFRHRAPIFMTRFDTERECLIREEEVILVPELGARLGNFSVTEPNDRESWLITAEWMQSWDNALGVCDRYGSNNSFWIARVRWEAGTPAPDA